MLVKAAVMYDALAINKQILGQRQKLLRDSTIRAANVASLGEETA